MWSGGLGVRSATQLAPSAFLASAAGCTNISRELIPPRLRDTPYDACEDALKAWSVGHTEPPPPVEVAHCRKSLGRHPHHMAINDIIKRSLASAKVSAHLEPAGICRSDGERPDGATIMPWKSGRVLVWDATCPDTFAPSHLQLAVREAGAVADQAGRKKKAKYAELAATHHFVPVAIETMGVFGKEAEAFFIELGCRIQEETGNPYHSTTYCNGSRWPCKGATQPQYWAPPP